MQGEGKRNIIQFLLCRSPVSPQKHSPFPSVRNLQVQTRADADIDTLNMNASSPRSVSDGELYSATVSDFSGSDPLIYKEPLRTDQSDSKHLNCECHSAITPYSDDDATSETEKNFVTGIFLWPLERTKVAREESFAFF